MGNVLEVLPTRVFKEANWLLDRFPIFYVFTVHKYVIIAK